MRLIAALLLWVALACASFAQSAILQSGPYNAGRVPMYVGPGSGQAVVADSGPAGGGAAGVGLGEQLLTARGTGTPPYVGQGTGPNGANWCNYDAPVTNATGYHYLCFSPNATIAGQTGGKLIYGAGGTATPLSFQLCINGTCLVPGGGISGITVGTTVISSGATTRVLYDNAGVLGEYTITGTGTVVAMQTSPSLLGVPLAPTAAFGTNTTQLATTAFVQAAVSASTVACSQLPALTGDVTTSAGSCATTLATVNSNVGTFGTATQVPQVTVNGKGLITAVSNVTIAGIPPGSLTLTSAHIFVGNGSNVAADVAASGDVSLLNTGAFTVAKINGATLGTTTATSGNLLIGSGTQWVTNAMSGDATITSGGVVSVNALHSGAFATCSVNIGLSAVAGTATTAVRSDGSCALSQAIAPTWTGRHIWGDTPSYNLGSNTLAVSILFPLDTSSHTVAAGNQFNHTRVSQSGGGYSQFTVGANAIVSGHSVFIESLSGSDTTSNTYGHSASIQCDGPGTCKAAHFATFGSGTSSAVLGTLSAGVTPVATSSVSSFAIEAVLNSSGVNDVATGIQIKSGTDRFLYGIGNNVAAVPINQAFYDAWMATASSAGAKAFQVRDNAGTIIGFIDKVGAIQSGAAGTQSGSVAIAGSSSGLISILPQAAAGTYNFNLPITVGSSGQCLTSAGGGSSPMTWSSCGATSGLTVGTSTISSGTTTRILYDNAGVLGEYTITGSGTVVAMQTSPAFTTPAIGAATGSSLVLTGTGANALAVGRQGATNPVLNVDASAATVVTGLNLAGTAAGSRMLVSVTSSGADEGLSIDAKGAGTIRLGATSTGAVEFSRNAVPTSSDGAALGTTALMWSDLFLASGAVINFNNGNVAWTHSAGVITQNSGNFNAPTVTGGTTSNGVDISTGSVTRNNAAGNLTVTAGNNDGTNISFQVGVGGGASNAILATKSRYTITSWHLEAGAGAAGLAAPTLSSCGTSPAITGNDFMGVVTMGTASPTGCVITFASAYTGTPYCTVTWQTNIASMQYTVSNTAITLTQTGTSSNKVNYYCMATNGG